MADLLTWAPDLDNAADDYSSAVLCTKSLWFQLFKALRAAGWTVAGTSDSSTAGMDGPGTNRLGDAFDAAKWVNAAAGSAHSWFVLSHATLAHHICVDLSNVTTNIVATLTVAKTAFTGGSATARPTSLDEWTHAATALTDNTATLHRLNLTFATRGDFVAFTVKTGVQNEYAQIMVLQLGDLDATAGDGYPVVSYFGANFGSGYANLFSTAASPYLWRGRTGGGALCGAGPYLMASTAGLIGAASPLVYLSSSGGQWRRTFPKVDIKIWVYDTNANGYTDYKGEVADIQAGQLTLAHGAPDALPATRRSFGALWLPGMVAAAPTY